MTRLGHTLIVGWACVGLTLPLPANPSESWVWTLPPGVSPPRVPADNPMTMPKAELGRHLFYDTRLSGNGTQSCASCHLQQLAFTDGLARAVGSTGEVHPRSSMSLANVAYNSTLTWADPDLRSLEEQQLGPMFGTDPVELGLAGRERELLARLRDSAVYPALFAEAFPEDENPFTIQRVLDAIATFERTLVSFDSPYDQYLRRGRRGSLGKAERLGEELFFSVRMGCADCHGGPFFTNAINHIGQDGSVEEFFNTGLYDLDGAGQYPEPNTGVHASTGDPADMGRFRAPTLRNIAVTAPYMHDGSIATLDDVLTTHYMPGGRTDSPLRSDLMVRFGLSPQERAAVIAFLESLTDETFLTNPQFSDPWPDYAAR
ncbi:MAG: MbnH family di-heme enzyme [Pseudomonadota bacterium]